MPLYPVPQGHDPKYGVLDGRHRTCAAWMRGAPTELRCDVITESGHALRVIPVDELAIDHDVQLDFAYNERWSRNIANNWSDRLVGVITVVPLNGAGLSVAERARIKLGLDRDRRSVRAIESFIEEEMQGEPNAREIRRICNEHGFDVGKCRGGRPYERIEAVRTLRQIYGKGPDRLSRVLALNTLWLGEPKTNNNNWLGGLGIFVANGWDDRLSDQGYKRLRELIPGKVLREAIGLSQAHTTGLGMSGGMAPIIAEKLRKTARVRPSRSRG